MNYILTLPYTLLTQGIYTGIIGTISTITMSTCRIITSIYNQKNPNINAHLRKLDIEHQLKIIGSVLHKLHYSDKIGKHKIENNNLSEFNIIEDYTKSLDPIELCLIYIKESIDEINKNLIDIDNTVRYHNTKWFSSWRKLNIKKKLEILELNAVQLNKRFDYLIKITNFLSNKHIN